MIGRLRIPFVAFSRPIFRGKMAVSFREGMFSVYISGSLLRVTTPMIVSYSFIFEVMQVDGAFGTLQLPDGEYQAP